MASLLPRTVRRAVAAAILTVCGHLLPQAADAASCARRATAKTDILGVMNDLFAALRTDSKQRFEQVTAPGLYAYDNGMRLTGPAMLELIKKGHAAGKQWVWSVTDPEVHVSCNLAWITYVNLGSVGDASGSHPQTWLESAILEYSHGRWRIRFVHSTRVPNKTWRTAKHLLVAPPLI